MPSVPGGSELVVIAGSGVTVTVADAVFVVSAAEVAVMVTTRLPDTLAGALYVTDVVVTLVSVPHAVPVQAVPDTVQVTPLLPESFATAAVKLTV